MRILYYRLFGFLIVFILAVTANHMLLNRKKSCQEEPQPPVIAQQEQAQPAQGVVLLEGRKQATQISAGQYPQSLKAEDLYEASLPAVKTILAAQSQFLSAHQKYADNLAQLNLELLPDTEETSLPSSIQSSFNILLTETYAEAVHYSFPISPEENYTLRFYYDGRVTCIAKGAASGNTCSVISKISRKTTDGTDSPQYEQQENTYFSPVIQGNVIEYILPKDFLAR